MSALQGALAVVGALFALAALGGGLWAAVTTANKDAQLKRIRDENGDLYRRLDWLEPKFKEAEEHNRLLKQLNNPTSLLEANATASAAAHQETHRLIEAQAVTLHEIDEKLTRSHRP